MEVKESLSKISLELMIYCRKEASKHNIIWLSSSFRTFASSATGDKTAEQLRDEWYKVSSKYMYIYIIQIIKFQQYFRRLWQGCSSVLTFPVV